MIKRNCACDYLATHGQLRLISRDIARSRLPRLPAKMAVGSQKWQRHRENFAGNAVFGLARFSRWFRRRKKPDGSKRQVLED